MESIYLVKNIIRLVAIVLIAGGIARVTNVEFGLGIGLYLTQIKLVG